MQLEPDLVLEKAVTLAWQSESVKTKQPTVRDNLSQEHTIEVVRSVKSAQWKYSANINSRRTHFKQWSVVDAESKGLTAKHSA